MAPFDETLLHGTWVHAHEEDTGEHMVFRRNTARLPPSRGRTGYVFEPGGRVTRAGIGASDRTTAVEGTWSLEGGDRIRVRLPAAPDRLLPVVSVDADRLVLKKT